MVDYGGAPGERGQGELRLIAADGTDALAGTRPLEPALPSRLLASGLDGPTGVARLPDGRWVMADLMRKADALAADGVASGRGEGLLPPA